MLKRMKRKAPVEEDPTSSEDETSSQDSDNELREAFLRGELKSGLNTVEEAPRTFVNDTKKLQSKFDDINLKLEWVERLDLTTDVNDIVEKILENKEKVEPKYKIETPGDNIVDDLQRETLFYRQAQAAIIEGLSRLKALGIPTKRPDDYFAQMAKSDDHMLKVKRKVLEQQLGQEKAAKVKKLRELKKYGKKVQVEVALQRAKEKRELLSKVKQYREGKLNSLDFLEENQGKKKNILEVTKQKTKERNEAKMMNQHKGKGKVKRAAKDKKFGFGGKKSGLKKNNMKQSDEPIRFKGAKGGKGGKGGKGAKKGGKAKGGRKR